MQPLNITRDIVVVLTPVVLVVGFVYYPKQELSSFGYVPQSFSRRFITDIEWCSQPSSDEDFVSKCAERKFVCDYLNDSLSPHSMSRV